jgi:anti-anti-sigma regulatory factor
MLSELHRPLSATSSLMIDVRSAECSQPPHIDLAGSLVEPHARRLHKTVIDLRRSGRPRSIDLNLASVTVVDASGIRVLELCCEDARQLGCEVRVRDLHPVG